MIASVVISKFCSSNLLKTANLAAILKSKMAAHLVELVFAETHSLTHNAHFETKMGLLSLLEAKILAKH